MNDGPPAVAPPDDVETVAPSSVEELAEVLAKATVRSQTVAIWGGGTHRSVGNGARPNLVISTAALTGIEDWEPDDLTVVVGAGMAVGDLEAALGAGGQTAVLPELAGAATVGGVVATGSSGFRRLRYGPTRDRVLEVRAVTGDGRVVKGGGRVVKNVSGYDLPRLYCGSLGSLGVITSVCFKLWPLTQATATVFVEDLDRAAAVHRPLAVLQSPGDVRVMVAGTGPEVEDLVARLGGERREGLDYPKWPQGEAVWSVRVPPSRLTEAVAKLPAGVEFVAQHGVGDVTFAVPDAFAVDEIRGWAESQGGSVVRLSGASSADPWGTPPGGLHLQRRLVAAFDPGRILEPGRLPGGI